MSTLILAHRAAISGVAGLALVAALGATLFAVSAPNVSAEFAANASPVVIGEVALVNTVVQDSSSGGILAGE